MPSAAPRPCGQPGCASTTFERYCPVHKKAAQKVQDNQRGTASKRGYGSRWRRYRLIFIAANPLCCRCLANGRVTATTVVDHIKPHKGNMVLFWDRSNHQGLCKQCHDVKTATEDGGFGR